MTQFKKDFNKLLKREGIAALVDAYERGVITLNEAIISISERICLEEDVFNAVRNDGFTMFGITEGELKKKIEKTPTGDLSNYMDWFLNGRRAS